MSLCAACGVAALCSTYMSKSKFGPLQWHSRICSRNAGKRNATSFTVTLPDAYNNLWCWLQILNANLHAVCNREICCCEACQSHFSKQEHCFKSCGHRSRDDLSAQQLDSFVLACNLKCSLLLRKMRFAPGRVFQNIAVSPWEVSMVPQGFGRLAARLQTDPLQTHGLLKFALDFLVSCNVTALLSAARKCFKVDALLSFAFF